MEGPRRDLRIRPLGLGETLDRAVALHRRHFRMLFLVTLAFELPLFLVARLELGRAGEILLASRSDGERLAALLGLLPALGVTLLAMLLGQLLLSAAAARVVLPSAAGDGASGTGEGGLRRVVAVVGASLASALALLLAPLVGAIPGVLLAWRAVEPATRALGVGAALLGAILAYLWALLAFLLAPPVSAVEGRGGLAALWRSWRLMRPVPGAPLLERPALRASVVLLAALAITLAANTVAGLPRGVALAWWDPAIRGGLLPVPLEVVVTAIELAAVAALRPFALVAVAVLYFDRRARREGLDLEAWARSLAHADG